MRIDKCKKESFVVIGKEGSTHDGDGFIKRLWEEAGYEYIYTECESPDTFPEVIKYMKENDIPLAGAVHDFTCPQTGKNYMFFPIGKL